jgi:hypothetical protein
MSNKGILAIFLATFVAVAIAAGSVLGAISYRDRPPAPWVMGDEAIANEAKRVAETSQGYRFTGWQVNRVIARQDGTRDVYVSLQTTKGKPYKQVKFIFKRVDWVVVDVKPFTSANLPGA